ncbi:MAG: hypothetical protein QOK71_07385, partial [Nitrososphaeraceae archaeon]|nr:hypothetical protein [Nitrososphaeraceae archaeon]
LSFSMVDQISRVLAHSFTTDDASYFLGLDKRTKVELELAEKNYPSNITLLMDHIDNTVSLLNEIYFAENDIVNDNDFSKRYSEVINSYSLTTYPLVVADLLDATLREYANAIVTDIDLTNMSNLVLLNDAKNLSVSTSSDDYPNNSNITKFFSNDNPVFNYANYETAKALGIEIKYIFETHLVPPSNYIGESRDIILKLEKDFEKFSNLINDTRSPAELMELVHLQIHPLLQEGYGLQTTNMYMDDGQMNMD